MPIDRNGSRLILARILILSLGAFTAPTPAADILTEGFDDIADLTGKGWSLQNLSSPIGVTDWFQGSEPVFPAQAGPPGSYLGANFENVDLSGTISNWAITPTRTYSDGDTFSFYTRTTTDSTFADRLEVRLSTSGSSADVGDTALSVGDFDTLLLTINENLISDGYPQTWTQYVITLSGLGAPTQGRIALRYFVTDAGSEGDNANFIGIDTLVITNAVPEPSTLVLAGFSLVTLAVVARKRHPRT